MMVNTMSMEKPLKRFGGGEMDHSRTDQKNGDVYHHRIFFRQHVSLNLFRVEYAQHDQKNQQPQFSNDPVGLPECAGFDREHDTGKDGDRKNRIIDEFVNAVLDIPEPIDLFLFFKPQAQDDRQRL